ARARPADHGWRLAPFIGINKLRGFGTGRRQDYRRRIDPLGGAQKPHRVLAQWLTGHGCWSTRRGGTNEAGGTGSKRNTSHGRWAGLSEETAQSPLLATPRDTSQSSCCSQFQRGIAQLHTEWSVTIAAC